MKVWQTFNRSVTVVRLSLTQQVFPQFKTIQYFVHVRILPLSTSTQVIDKSKVPKIRLTNPFAVMSGSYNP